MLTSFLTLLSLLILPNASWAKFDINDVTVLFDLPRSYEGQSFLLGAESRGVRDQLLTREQHQKIQPLVSGTYDLPKDEYKSLRVVGLRIDPCFKFTDSPKCHPQLRLIWQPVELQKDGYYSTFDASLHSFYALSQTEFKLLVEKFQWLKKKNAIFGVSTDRLPLQVHPALKHKNTRLFFNSELKKTVLEFAGQKNLIRITYMKLAQQNFWWTFGGFERKNGELTKIVIPRVPKDFTDQQFFNEAMNEPMGMDGAFAPELVQEAKENNLTNLLYNYSYNFSTAKGRKYVKSSLETLDKIENPNHFTPETIDCIHCHVAQAARAWLLHTDKEFYKENNKTAFRFRGENIQNTSTSKNNPKSLRIFGYFGKKPAIGQRVINESAEVVKALNHSF